MDDYETMLAEVTVEGHVKQPETKRSECTKSRALSYSTPVQAPTDLDFKPQASAAAKLLIEECAASSGLNDIATEVRADHEARIVNRHKATLEQKKAAQ